MTPARELILIVDDDPDIADFIEKQLRAASYDVARAEDGLVGLERVRPLRPDLVITNVMMSGIDGFEMTRGIRSEPEISDTPILILTAKAMAEDKLRGLVSGADDYLIKPFDPVELVRRVAAILVRTSPGTRDRSRATRRHDASCAGASRVPASSLITGP